MSVLMPEHRERAFGAGQDYVRTEGGIFVPPWSEPAQPLPPMPFGIGLFDGAGGFALGMHTAGIHVVAGNEAWPIAAETYLCNLGSPDTLVYVGEKPLPDATKKDRALYAAHAGELVPAGELFDSAGSGWISNHSDHEPLSCATHMTLEGDDDTEEKLVERRRGFHEAYCLGGRDWAARACEMFFLCDVHELTGEIILGCLGCESDDIAIVFGGPPCQGFSKANGNRSRHDSRNQLVFEFARLVCEIQPRSMVMENVPGIVSMVTPEGVPVIDALTLIFEQGGMGEYEALRRSLLVNVDAGAVVRGTKSLTKKRMEANRDALVGPPTHGDPDGELDEQQLALEIA